MNEKNQFSQILGKESLENFFMGSLALIGSDLPHTTKVLALIVSNEINKANKILLKYSNDSAEAEYVEHFRDGNKTCVTLCESVLCDSLHLSKKQVKRIATSLNEVGFSYSYYYSKKLREGFYTFEGSILPAFNDHKIYIPRCVFDFDFSSSTILTYLILLNNLLYNKKNCATVNYTYVKKILHLSSSSVSKALKELSAASLIQVKNKMKFKDGMYTYNLFSTNTSINLSCVQTSFHTLDSLKLENLESNSEDGLMKHLRNLVEIKEKKEDKNEISDEKTGITGDIFCDNNIIYLKSYNSFELSQLAEREEERIYISRVLAAKKFHLFKRLQILKAKDIGLSEEIVDARISCFIQMYLKVSLVNFRRMLRNDSRADRKLYFETLESGPFANRKIFILANLFFNKNLELCAKNKVKDMINYGYTSFVNLFSKTLNWDITNFEVKSSVFC